MRINVTLTNIEEYDCCLLWPHVLGFHYTSIPIELLKCSRVYSTNISLCILYKQIGCSLSPIYFVALSLIMQCYVILAYSALMNILWISSLFVALQFYLQVSVVWWHCLWDSLFYTNVAESSHHYSYYPDLFVSLANWSDNPPIYYKLLIPFSMSGLYLLT